MKATSKVAVMAWMAWMVFMLAACGSETAADDYIGIYRISYTMTLQIRDTVINGSADNEELRIQKGNSADLLLDLDGCTIPADIKGDEFVLVSTTCSGPINDEITFTFTFTGTGYFDSRDRLVLEMNGTGTAYGSNGNSAPASIRFEYKGSRL